MTTNPYTPENLAQITVDRETMEVSIPLETMDDINQRFDSDPAVVRRRAAAAETLADRRRDFMQRHFSNNVPQPDQEE